MASKASQDEPSQDAASPADTAAPPIAAVRGRATRQLLFAGVAGACVLGLGLGLWARPGEAERRLSLTAAHGPTAPGQPKPTLQIVLGDKALASVAPRPAPVLASDHPVASSFAAAPPLALTPEPIAPSGPPQGLMKAHAVTTPVVTPAPQPDLIAQAAAAQRRQAAADAAEAKAQAEAARQKAAAQKLAAAKAEKTEKLAAEKAAHAQALAKADKAAKAAQLAKAVKAQQAETARLAGLDARKTKLARAKVEAAHKSEELRLARAEAAAQAAAIDARKHRIADLAHKLAQAMERKRTEAAEARAEAQREVKLAEAKAARAMRARAEQARIEKATLQRRQDAAARAAQKRTIHGEGPLRLASNHCASGDAAAALVCADPGLSSADRQMNRVYHEAEAAGVPGWRLHQQQQRWLQARAAAAREAPWAVHDVYVARIAELQDQARNAGAGGY
jgi:chemotaxis protein histidine kinase CheA